MPGGVSSPVRAYKPYPFFTSHAKGSKLYDVDGKEYVDYCMAYGSLMLGHAHHEVVGQIREQLKRGFLYGTPTEVEVELADAITNLVPSVEMLRFVNTGTEATMHAIRLARGYTGKKKIIKFEGCYHGAHDAVLVGAGSGATTFGVPTSLGVPQEVAKQTMVLPYNNLEALEEAVRKSRGEMAAVLVEPVIGNYGLILPKKGYLEALRKMTKEEGILLIFDEVITGFRLTLGGAQGYYGVMPDLTTLGKVMGGGFPLAAFGGKKELMEMISPVGKVYQAGTFSGNPVSVIAGLATLKILIRERQVIYERLRGLGEGIRKGLTDIISARGLTCQVNQLASMFQLYFTKEKVVDHKTALSSDRDEFDRYHRGLLQRGIFVPPSQFETCFISLTHTDEEVGGLLEAVDEVLRTPK